MTCTCGHARESHPRPGAVVAFVSGACMAKDSHGNGCGCKAYQAKGCDLHGRLTCWSCIANGNASSLGDAVRSPGFWRAWGNR